MSAHQAFRRVPVDQQLAQALRTINIPAPTRGIIQDENEAFMTPGGALIQDNWAPTLKGVKLRGGCIRWVDLHALDAPAWVVAHAYIVGNQAYDGATGTIWQCAVAHTSAATGTFAADRAARPTFWTAVTFTRKPVISAFEYIDGVVAKMFAAQADKLFDVSASGLPTLIVSGQSSGNWAAAQITSAGGNFLVAVNDGGADFPQQYNGTTWTTLSADQINGPAGSPVQHGKNLVHVWKYRGRLFFIQASSMNAYCLGPDSNSGLLKLIPLAGAAGLGGRLLFGASWSIDAGDGIDDKCVFVTDQGELLIFSGSDPTDINNWRQEGRYKIAPPLGMNAHIPLGGDLLIATVEGIVPVSQAITKTAEQLDLAAITRTIKSMWRDEVTAKRGLFPWSMKNWNEYGGIFVTLPGGKPGAKLCLVANNATGAWCRFVGWDATCFIRQRGDMFFGTQDGIVMQADRTGYDDGQPYVAILVGGWELFQSGGMELTWHQARASFTSSAKDPFQPQLDAATDYVVTLPPPPAAGPDPGLADVWDQGLWDVAKWDQPSIVRAPIRNTMWVSIGKLGFSHAPIVQVTVAQQATPNVELIAIAATFERAGVNV